MATFKTKTANALFSAGGKPTFICKRAQLFECADPFAFGITAFVFFKVSSMGKGSTMAVIRLFSHHGRYQPLLSSDILLPLTMRV